MNRADNWKKISFWLDAGVELPKELSPIVTDLLYQVIQDVIDRVEKSAGEEKELEFRRNDAKLLHFTQEGINKEVFKFLSPARLDHWNNNAIKETSVTMTKVQAIAFGAYLGALADRHGMIKRSRAENISQDERQFVQKAVTVVDQMQKVVKKAGYMYEELSDEVKTRIEVAEFLKTKHPKIAVRPKLLHKLPNKIKSEGRSFIRAQWGSGPKADNLCKEIFRSPRKSTSRSEDEWKNPPDM